MATKWLHYNVDEPVGKGRPNLPDDVYLVRFFIRRISQQPDLMSPYAKLPLTGTFDQQLGEAILWFQKLARSKGQPMAQDGIVDPAKVGEGCRTITSLNGVYRKRYPKYSHSIESDPEFPNALRPSFADTYY